MSWRWTAWSTSTPSSSSCNLHTICFSSSRIAQPVPPSQHLRSLSPSLLQSQALHHRSQKAAQVQDQRQPCSFSPYGSFIPPQQQHTARERIMFILLEAVASVHGFRGESRMWADRNGRAGGVMRVEQEVKFVAGN
ncbi:hypothetical protein ACFX13_013643 [Malus domestica]